MNRAIDQFNINIETVKHLGVIYSAFENHLTPAVDLSDILRSEIVLAVLNISINFINLLITVQ